MIRQWKIRNFKAIQDDMFDLEFAPITVFAGANSSGKSTVIQSILLVMQTLASQKTATLALNGELVSMGAFDDIWNYTTINDDGEVTDTLDYTFSIDGRNNDIIDVHLKFFPISGTETRLVEATYQILYEDTDLSLTVRYNIDNDEYELVDMSPLFEDEIIDRFNDDGLQEIQPLVGNPIRMNGLFPGRIRVTAKTPPKKINWENALVDPFDKRLNEHDLSQEVSEEYKQLIYRVARRNNIAGFVQQGSHNTEIEVVHTLGDYRNWFYDLSQREIELLQNELKSSLDNLYVDENKYKRIPIMQNDVEKHLGNQMLNKFRYLGAHRIQPQIVFSPDITSKWSEVGINGANVAATLRENSLRTIRWYDPKTFSMRETSLIHAVGVWLQFFGLLENIMTEEQGKLGTMLKIRSHGVQRDLDLTSVGFGTSQILPIIVQGLLTPPSGVFIVEQPEVHLHPHLQSLLANFFVALTMANVQCIVETHSENLVNQLRLFIAKKDLNLRDDIRLYFAQRDEIYGTSFEEVMLDDDGDIMNWPNGFMDESKHQAELMLAAILGDSV